MSELELPAVLPELAAADPLPELTPFERHRLAQREAEERSQIGYLPRVLHAGDDQVPPLLRTASGAAYAVRVHRRRIQIEGKVDFVESVQHIRVDRAPKSKKERRRLRALAKAQRAAMPATVTDELHEPEAQP